jgi:hypothetical protein
MPAYYRGMDNMIFINRCSQQKYHKANRAYEVFSTCMVFAWGDELFYGIVQ